MPSSPTSALSLALGRIPTGLYVVTALGSGGPVGFVASFVMQVGFEPPAVCVAVAKDRPQLEVIRASGRFAVCILDDASNGVMTAFLKRGAASPFQKLKAGRAPGGSPVLEEALAWVECRLTGEHECADHAVLFGEGTDGQVLREGEPSIHLRKSGLVY
jgi:flavin reductase (DIM6/NTAB) family NADH-FMN oxidoreductase RutF